MKIHDFPTNLEQSSALTEQMAKLIQQLISQQGSVTIAVSGGKSPIKFFEQLSLANISWDKVTLTLVDERFLPTTHPESNENLVRNHLLINQAVNAYFIGLVSTSNILSSINNANLNIKNIDIAILGMGEDGHTASIFPCCDELTTILDTELTPEKYVITNPKTANYQRIGLSLTGILAIPHLFVSINGNNKLGIIKESALNKNLKYPISYVLNERNDVEIFWYA